MTRMEMWLEGTKVKASERVQCGCCRNKTGIREFDFGFFCRGCFLNAKTCANIGCENPIQADKKLGLKICRLCMFSYEGEYIQRNGSGLSEAQTWAIGGKHGCLGLSDDLDKAMKKHGIKARSPRKNWFYPPAKH